MSHSVRVLVACEYSGRVRDAFTAKKKDRHYSQLSQKQWLSNGALSC